MWSQISSSKEAKAERTSNEINYAYALNGGFIVMAIIGLYIDSFTQCRRYYRRWAILNQHLVILPCDLKENTKNESFESPSSAVNISDQISTEPTHNAVIMSISSHHSGLGQHQIANFDLVLANPIHLHSYYLNEENMEVNEHWSLMSSSLQLPSEGQERFSFRESHSAPISLQYSQIIRESYV